MKKNGIFKAVKLMTAASVAALGVMTAAHSKIMASEPVNQYLQFDNDGWHYYSDNQIDMNFKGLVSNEYGWWYVENGTINFNYNGLAQNEYGWWKITNGTVDFGYTGLAYDESVGWWYVENGAINFNYNGLAQNEYGWWKITNGTVDFGYTGLAYDESVGWWYVENGAINFNYNGLAQNEYGWWKITNGTVDFGYTGLAYDESVGWWYIENGAINFNYNCLAQNEYGWWKITNGTVDFGYTGLAFDEKVGWWYVENGTINFDYNGTYDGKEIVNGCVVSEEPEEDFDGYDRFGNKFVERLENGAYRHFLDANNPYPLDTYEWADNDKCLYIIKDIGVFSSSELEEPLQNMLSILEQPMIDMWDEKNSQDNRGVTFIPAVIGCYNGHWIVKYELIIADELNKYMSEVFFYDKDGNPWHHKDKG